MAPEDDNANRPGRGSFADGFRYANAGFFSALRSERNLRVHCVIAVLALIACAVLKVEFWGWICVIILIGLVISAELFNTALESVVDLASPQFHPLAKRAKDIAASAVLVTAITSVVAGLAIYITAFLRLIG